MSSFLKTKNIEVDGEQVTITQLSGLERYDFLDYCSDLPKPEAPDKPAEDASAKEMNQYYEAMLIMAKKWERLSFIGQARLVAYGTKFDIDDLDERHQYIMSSMMPDQVKQLHVEIANFSGIPLPEVNDESEELDDSQKESESSDPKG